MMARPFLSFTARALQRIEVDLNRDVDARAARGHIKGEYRSNWRGALACCERQYLARWASGIHATIDEARDYARREGPMVVLTPDGEVLELDRQRDTAEDARTAALEAEYAERRRWTDAPREPRFRPMGGAR